MLRLAFAGRGGNGHEGAADEQDAHDAGPVALWRFAEPLLWIALYVLLAEWGGFLLVTSALLLLYLTRLGTRLSVAAADHGGRRAARLLRVRRRAARGAAARVLRLVR